MWHHDEKVNRFVGQGPQLTRKWRVLLPDAPITRIVQMLPRLSQKLTYIAHSCFWLKLAMEVEKLAKRRVLSDGSGSAAPPRKLSRELPEDNNSIITWPADAFSLWCLSIPSKCVLCLKPNHDSVVVMTLHPLRGREKDPGIQVPVETWFLLSISANTAANMIQGNYSPILLRATKLKA